VVFWGLVCGMECVVRGCGAGCGARCGLWGGQGAARLMACGAWTVGVRVRRGVRGVRCEVCGVCYGVRGARCRESSVPCERSAKWCVVQSILVVC
jgi:hypothetical protein